MNRDSFAKVAVPTPARVTVLELVLRVSDAQPQPNVYAMRYAFDQVDAGGLPVERREGDLLAHLTPAQQNAIRSFLDAMLTKAQGTI